MKAEFLNPFLRAVVHIIEENIGEKPLSEKPFLRPQYPYTTETVAIIIGVTGYLTGQVVLSIPEETAKGIAAAMMLEPSIYELDEYAQSALAELSNMIVANATIGLSEAGYPCDITPPSVITGKRIEITSPSSITTIVLPLFVKGGKVEVNLSLVESSALMAANKERMSRAEAADKSRN